MKGFFCSLSLVLVTLVTVSCGTVRTIEDVPPYTYTGDRPIAPAVYYSVKNWPNGVHFKEFKTILFDFDDVIMDNVKVSDGLKMAAFTLRICLVNNVVTYQFSNIRHQSIGSSEWVRADRFLQSDREIIFTSYFNTEIPKVMESDELYLEVLEELTDPRFSY